MKRQDRKIDCSPDYRYLMVPSLDDKQVPSVAQIDRTKDFSIVRTFIGPFSSINCLRFSPVLYRYQDKVINVCAMGDNDGNVQLWGIGDSGFQSKHPFFFLKSHIQGSDLIEDIAWSADGSCMIATTLKRYVIVVKFFEKVFGDKLSETEKKEHNIKNFGKIIYYLTDNRGNQIETDQLEEEQQNQQSFGASGNGLRSNADSNSQAVKPGIKNLGVFGNKSRNAEQRAPASVGGQQPPAQQGTSSGAQLAPGLTPQ